MESSGWKNDLIAAVLLVSIGMAPVAAAADGKVAPGRDYRLRLAGFAFDPLDGLPALASDWGRASVAGPDLHLVQLHGPTRAGSLEVIRGHGVDIVQYIHPFTYVVWGSGSDVRDLASAQTVRAMTEFAPALRVQPQWRRLGADRQDVRVLLYRGADTDAVVKAIGRLGGLPAGRRTLNEKFEIAGFSLAGDQIRAAVAIPGVYSLRLVPTDGGLRGEMSDQVCANNVDGGNIAFPGYPAWLAAIGVDGQGVAIANVDGGINQSHPDLSQRILPCTGDTCGGSDSSSHGTHTAGIMAADGSSGTLDGFGFLRGLGVAPGAGLVEQVYSPWFTQPGGMLKLMTDSSRNGASLSGNSWGPSGSPHGYDDDTLQVDIGVRDADPAAPGNQPLTYVLSLMNGNGGTSTQGTPDEAKNIFTIGSTKMQTSSGAQIPDIDDLSSNSAHGPCLDQRKIPHMVAPGCRVDSTDTGGGGYGLKCGTSMASPHVSGAVALFIEHYRGLPDYVEDPSPAMVKAAFLAVGRDLAGNEDADGNVLGHPFDSKQGWGRMDLEAVIDPPENGVSYFDDPLLLDDTGEEWTRVLSPLDPGQPVRIMLVWTDAPGHGLGGSTPAWNNDLDLVVEAGPDTYLGNHFGADGMSVPGGSADFMNNTEGVFLDAGVAAGGFTIRVVASNISSDGVPGAGDDTDQDFALACYNCAIEPGFTLAVDPTSRAVCAPADAGYGIEIGEILGFDDPVTLSVDGVPAGATASFTVNPVIPPGTSTLNVTDTSGAQAGTYALSLDASAGELQRSVDLGLRIDAGTPGAPVLEAPADGASDVPVTPQLSWTAVPQTITHRVEVARDPDFDDVVYGASEPGTSHQVATPLDPAATYYWRVRAENACGEGVWSEVFVFTTLDFPAVLLVDDDDNSPDVRAAYTDALEGLGIDYDLWDTGNSDTEPAFADLAPYELVIWFTGDEFGGAAGPGSAGETALAAWLDTGRCLLLGSQDYHYDRGMTQFMQSYLGVSFVDNDEAQTTVTGQGGVFADLGPYTLSFPYSNYTDIVNPDGTAETAFAGDQGSAAVSKASGPYLTTFWSFGLETLPTPADRLDVLAAFVQACDALPQQDWDEDGTPNDQDCAPLDGEVWTEPGPAEAFRVDKTLFGPNLSWRPPGSPGATSVTYDVVRSLSASDYADATCVAADIGGTRATDQSDPGSGGIYHYLVRVRNACGETMGVDSAGEPRPHGAQCN